MTEAVTKWAKAPSCPNCGLNDEVEQMPKPIDDKSLFCGRATCLLVFGGTDAEWRAYRRERERANA